MCKMGYFSSAWVFVILSFHILSSSATVLPHREKSVQAFSEGSDCRCKCILSAEDGGPCDDNVAGRARKTIYTVETISGGSDCRCSCNTPPPARCETPTARARSSHASDVGLDRTKMEDGATENHEAGIDPIELHSSISNMVAAMVKLERAVVKKSSPDELRVLRNNVNKVVLDLKNTNGSYTDLLADLKLDTEQIKTAEEEHKVSEDNVAIPPLEPPTTAPNQREDPTEAVESIGVAPDDQRDIAPASFLRQLVNGMRSGTSSSKGVEKSWKTVDASSDVGITDEIRDDLDIIRSFVRSKVASRRDDDEEPIEKLASTQDKDNVGFDTAESIRLKASTYDVSAGKIVEPEIISFVPFRSAHSKPYPGQGQPLLVGPPGVSPDITSKSDGDDGYQYDYEYFDTDGEHTDNSTTEEPIPDDAFELLTTAAEELDENTDAISSTAAAMNASAASANGIEDSTQVDYSYSDYLEQYGKEDENFDGYVDQYYEEDIPLNGNVTEETTTARVTSTAGPYDACGTLFNISRPKVVSHFGRREGAWMRDPIPSTSDPDREKRIFIANFYYGSNLIEFQSVEGVRDLRWRNSYSLPHKWIGTGHIVYNGSFYYNRAFSRSLIKYDLQYRFVSAWSHMANAVYDPTTPFTWRGHSMVHMAADGDGLWVIFPSQDPLDSDATLTYVINKINPIDLKIEKSFKSTIRQSVAHVFMICGVVYSTERYNTRHGLVTHAFDTKTSAHRYIYLRFENRYSYSVQMLYNPKERKIYAWDNGRQTEYDVSMIH